MKKKKIYTGSRVKIIDYDKIIDWQQNYDKLDDNLKRRYVFKNSVDDIEHSFEVIKIIGKLNVIYELGTPNYCLFIDRSGIKHIEDFEESSYEEEIETEETSTNDIVEQISFKINNTLEDSLNKINRTLDRKSHLETALIEGIVDKGKELAVEDIKNKLLEDCDKYIEEHYGILPKVIKFETDEKVKEMQGIFHNKFEEICKIVRKDIPLMLTGPAGAGKNYTLEQVAEALDLDFYFTNSITQEYKLTGFIDANGTYHETEFYKAFTKGGLFFLDEVDASIPEALIILNSAIANRYFDFPTGRVKAHKDFRVVCAGNTYGTGADMIYVGRNVLDGATLDRFVVVEFDYDKNVERQLSYDEELFNFINELRNTINRCSLRYIVSMRALINASKLLEIGIDKSTILKTTIIKNMQIDDLNTVINKFNNTESEWYKELQKLC